MDQDQRDGNVMHNIIQGGFSAILAYALVQIKCRHFSLCSLSIFEPVVIESR